jgi:hypothetical protein
MKRVCMALAFASLAAVLAPAGQAQGRVSIMVGADYSVAGVLSDPNEYFVGPVGLFGGEFVLNIGPRFGLAVDADSGERTQKASGGDPGSSYDRKTRVRATYFDFLATVRSPVGEKGLAYLGVGPTIAQVETHWQTRAAGGVSDDVDWGTSTGLVLGGGLVVPIEGRFVAYLKVRDRLVTGSRDDTWVNEQGDDIEVTAETPIGGPEIGVGLGYSF